MSSCKKLYMDEFNILMEQQDSVDANIFRSILNSFDMKNHVNKATHYFGHTLDLVIECTENPIVRWINVEPQNTISHHVVANLKKICRRYSKK